MADKQLGNIYGLIDPEHETRKNFLADISADGVNTVTVDKPGLVPVGGKIDIVNKSTGAVLASNRAVTSLTDAGVLTYDGADVAATPGTHAVYLTGNSDAQGAYFDLYLTDISRLRYILKQKDSSYYTDARLDTMTKNDMIYAAKEI